jgi:hypothetical protein
MQTFLPYAHFKHTASVLDDKRLGKQRVEAWQILRALRGETKGWVSHPATIMWQGHEQTLIEYGLEICLEWKQRGFEDTLYARFEAEFNGWSDTRPWWIGYEPLHISHRSNLRRKDPIHYGAFTEPIDLPYIWCKPDGTFKVGEKPEVALVN